MFLPPEIRQVPRWNQPQRPDPRQEKLVTVFIALAMVLALLAPALLGTVFVVVRAMIGR